MVRDRGAKHVCERMLNADPYEDLVAGSREPVVAQAFRVVGLSTEELTTTTGNLTITT